MILLKNAKVFRHYLDSTAQRSDDFELVEVAFEGDRIFEIASNIALKCHREIDLKGNWLFPGLIDPQVHFREPGGEHKETIESGSRSAARGGFTAVVTMPNTNPTTDSPEVIGQVLKAATECGLVRILPTAAVTYGLKGDKLTDFAKLKRAGALAMTDDGRGIQKDDLMYKALELARLNRMVVLDHSEDESLSRAGAIHEGRVSKRYGIAGILPSSESEHVRRGCEYSLKTGGRYHVLHVSTKESLKWIREYKNKGAPVTVEVSPHHLLLCDEDIKEKANGELDANFKMNPPLRSREDMMACRDALRSGLIDAIATDHAPHSEVEKALPIEKAPFGIVGLESAFSLLYTYFVRTGELKLYELVDLMTCKAADLFELKLGRVRQFGPADFSVFDLNQSFKINPKTFYSKGRNTPFSNLSVYGDTLLTICRGRITYSNL